MTTERLDTTETVAAELVVRGTGDEPQEFELLQRRFDVGPLAIDLNDFTDMVRMDTPAIQVPLNGHPLSEIEMRHRRARADALMDPACLYLLHKFGAQQSLDINNLESLIAGPSGWLKVCLLVRADLIEIVGSDLRMTDYGNEALEETIQIIANIGRE